MNQYALICRSLLTDSRIILIGMTIGMLICLVSAVFGAFHLSIVFAMLACMGIGRSTFNFRSWETSRLVPQMNQKFAMSAIAVAALMWLIIASMVLTSGEPITPWLGLTTVAIGFGLWCGSQDSAAQYVILIFATASLIAGAGIIWVVSNDAVTQTKIVSWFSQVWQARPVAIVPALGVAGIWIGVAMIARYWLFSTSSTCGISFEPGTKSDKSKREASVSSFKFQRVRRLLSQSSTFNHQAKIQLICIAIIGIVLLLLTRGNQNAINVFAVFSSVFLLGYPGATFFVGTPQSFERLWITGVASGRRSTARILLTVTLHKSLLVFFCLAISVVLQTPFSAASLTPPLLVLTSAFAVSAGLVWFFARTYSYWTNISDLMIVGWIFVGLILFLIPFAVLAIFKISLENQVAQLIWTIGPITTLGIALTVGGLLWAWAIFDGAKSLSGYKRLME